MVNHQFGRICLTFPRHRTSKFPVKVFFQETVSPRHPKNTFSGGIWMHRACVSPVALPVLLLLR